MEGGGEVWGWGDGWEAGRVVEEGRRRGVERRRGRVGGGLERGGVAWKVDGS